MSIVAEKNSTPRTLAPAGNHIARCYSMIHIGTVDTDYMGELKQLNKVQITWELPNELHVFKEENGEQPFVISKEYTLSMHEKANLRKDLESWRGKGFTEMEAESFDITNLLSIPCMLNVIHKTSQKGNDYATVSGITPVPKGLDCPEQINPSFEFNFFEEFGNLEKLPEWLRDKIKKTPEYAFTMKQQGGESDLTEKEDDDLPF